jgi:DNA replication and repair protein RecF
MSFRQLRFYSFRNLADGVVDTSAREIILVGENGQGKTNFLEAVHLLCYGSSFRTSRDREMVRFEGEECRVTGIIPPAAEASDLALEQKVSVTLGSGKEIAIDDEAVKDRRELLSVQPCIVFCHDDIRFVSGSPDLQRLFLDQTVVLYDPGFVDTRRRYLRILRQRNDALKRGAQELLEPLDVQLVTTGIEVMARRREAVGTFNEVLGTLYQDVAEDERPVVLTYQPSWREPEAARDALSARRGRDLALGTTTSGPHRDKLLFLYDGRDYVATASTGQQRLLSLLLRLGQVHYYYQVHPRPPILLIDDVLLELDRGKRERLLSRMPPFDQAFYTFLPQEQIPQDSSEDRLIYSVERGQISRYGQS